MNIKDALFSWLRQAIEEDVVTIYFAGHGSPDTADAPENLFLLTYDAKYGNIATTSSPRQAKSGVADMVYSPITCLEG